MPRPTLLACLGIALTTTTTGCGTPQNSPRPGTPPIRQLALADLPQEPAHLDAPVELRDFAGAKDAPDVATREIVTRLEAQGLDILDIGTAVLDQSADLAVVRVWVVFATAETEHDSTYDVALRRDFRGWHLDDTREDG